MDDDRQYALARAGAHGHFLRRAALRGFDIGLSELVELEKLVSDLRPCFEVESSAEGQLKHRYHLSFKRHGKRRATLVYDARISALVTIF